MYQEISAELLDSMLTEWANIELIDVREKNEWDMVRIPGAKLIPMSSVQFRIDDIDFSRPVFIFCRSGARSGQVCAWLESEWKKATNVAGSIRDLVKMNSVHIEKTSLFQPQYFS